MEKIPIFPKLIPHPPTFPTARSEFKRFVRYTKTLDSWTAYDPHHHRRTQLSTHLNAVMSYLPNSSLRNSLLCGLPILYGAHLLYQRYKKNLTISLDSKAVCVTGCDSGIGLGIVSQLKKDSDAKIIALCLTPEGKANALQAGAWQALIVDLTDSIAVAKAASHVHAMCKAEKLVLFSVVHNAGIAKAGFIDFQTIQNFRSTMEVNFFAIVHLNSLLMPAIKANKGRVIIVTSVDGLVSLPGNAPYDCSKFAAEAFADALRVEMSLWGVHVSVINPSTMRTPLALGIYATQRTTWNEKGKEDPNGLWKREYSQEWLDEYIKVNTPNLEYVAEDPIVAVKDICHAIYAKYPKRRYLSGSAANTIFWALWCMPESWAETIKKFIINPKPNVLTTEQWKQILDKEDNRFTS